MDYQCEEYNYENSISNKETQCNLKTSAKIWIGKKLQHHEKSFEVNMLKKWLKIKLNCNIMASYLATINSLNFLCVYSQMSRKI